MRDFILFFLIVVAGTGDDEQTAIEHTRPAAGVEIV